MDDKAFDQAEVTLFFRKVKYRTQNNTEMEAMEIKPFASVRYSELGQEGGQIVPITITWDGAPGPGDSGVGHSGVKFFLEPAPINDENEWTHGFSGV